MMKIALWEIVQRTKKVRVMMKMKTSDFKSRDLNSLLLAQNAQEGQSGKKSLEI